MRTMRGKPKKKRRMRRSDRFVLWSLILCFPAGLVFMWTDRCRWSRTVKSGISLAIAAALAALFFVLPDPPERSTGGVEVVSLVPAMELYGPALPEDFESTDIYVPRGNEDYSIVAEPTPAPIPVYVYCNDSGKYYHTETCKYTKPTTPKVKLSQAIDQGFKRCSECNPPVE